MPALATYRITIPERYNDGKRIEREFHKSVRRELNGLSKGGYTWHPGAFGQGEKYKQEPMHIVWVDVPDTLRYAIFFRVYQKLLEWRFQQECIWIVRTGNISIIEKLCSSFIGKLFPIKAYKILK